MNDAISGAFLLSTILFAFSVILLAIKNVYGPHWSRAIETAYVLIVVTATMEIAYYNGFISYPAVMVSYATLCGGVFVLKRLLRSYTVVGFFFYATNIILSLIGVVWGIAFLASLDVSLLTRALLFATIPLLFFTLPFGVLQMIEQFDVLCRKVWHRPRNAMTRRSTQFEPMVSLHVPVYSEPPEVVIGTLNAIARLRYDRFEVIVVDNNTKDESLWRPVEAHCKTLGSRFRFFHVDPLEGAKAGALNFALTHTSSDADIIGLIDSDYHAHPNFIADLIGHFEDPKIGFVQTPHDYRDWEGNTFLTMCYWEYKAFFHTILVALNERDAALTIGTMCLLRKKAVDECGGWATWCLTEDSELSIRMHNLGYSSVYVPFSYGKGLIPESFADYVTQRRRWIAGPVQELKHHFKLYFGMTNTSSGLSLMQRFHHVHHGWGSTLFGLNPPLLVLTLLLSLSMSLHHEVIEVPSALWLSVTALFVANIILTWLHYRVILRTTVHHMMLGLLAHRALSHSVNMSALTTAIDSRQPWRRTNKFSQEQTVLSSLVSTRNEIMIGVFLSLSAVAMYSYLPVPGLLTMCLIGIGYKSFDYLAAPVVAYIAAKSHLQNVKSIDTSPRYVS